MSPTGCLVFLVAISANARLQRTIYDVGVMVARIRAKKPARIFLREWREHRGLTGEQLAERVGADKGTISKWENGRRAMNTDILSELAWALSCEPADLYSHPDAPSPADLLRNAPEDIQRQAIAVIAALVGRR